MEQRKVKYQLTKVFKDMDQSQIGINEVMYLEAKVNYTVLYANGQKFTSSRTLKNFEMMLNTNDFVRIHKSYMVNTSFICKLIYAEKGGFLKLRNGVKLGIARRRLSGIKEKLKSLNIT